MKRIINNIIFYLLLPFVGIAYLIIDKLQENKKEKKEKMPELRHQRKTTTYPVDQPEINDWFNYIHKQIK